MVPGDTDNIKKEYDILLDELKKFNSQMLDKHRVLAVTKCDLLDDELIEMLKEDLPQNLPVVFISSVTGQGITQLKDILWQELNSESNKLQSISEGGSLIHRDREVLTFNEDFSDWEDEEIQADEIEEEIDEYDFDELEDE